ncbi:hypothetical protein, partial [Salmonella enterica]
ANPSNYLEQSQRPNETTDDIKESDSWFKLLENTSPIDMLASWSESEPTLQQKRMVEELIEREKLSFGVINI